MDRIIGANTIDLGGGKRGFRGKDTVAGIAGTELTATWHNGVQEEIIRAIEGAGLVPSNADLLQLIKAIRLLSAGSLFVFTLSGLYTPSANRRSAALIIATGAGGSGAGGTGGGGGAGETVISLVPLAAIVSLAIAIGIGGSAAAVQTNGQDGGDTTVGAIMTAKGGKAGRSNIGGAIASGGKGGKNGTGQLLLPGNDGTFGSNSGALSAGIGGSSFWGGATRGANPDIAVPDDAATGSGSGGGYAGASAKAGNGVVFVLEV